MSQASAYPLGIRIPDGQESRRFVRSGHSQRNRRPRLRSPNPTSTNSRMSSDYACVLALEAFAIASCSVHWVDFRSNWTNAITASSYTVYSIGDRIASRCIMCRRPPSVDPMRWLCSGSTRSSTWFLLGSTRTKRGGHDGQSYITSCRPATLSLS